MNYQKGYDYEMWLNPHDDSIYSLYQGIKDPNLDRHSNKAKSRHFPVNGLGATNQSSSNDTRNIYNNPYTSTSTTSSSMQQQQQQQQQQHQQQMRHQQLSQHVYKSIAGGSTGGSSSVVGYDYSTPNPTDQQAAGISNSHHLTDAENAFLNHNNGSFALRKFKQLPNKCAPLWTTTKGVNCL
ncbi:uncharacterized protein [Musca autumnalis]|uniref:uncharacterized protein n=1 Tax=Musca autumnalis TaxID=221902 RepID=UPI003CEDBA2B